MGGVDERELVLGAKAGERAAFEALVASSEARLRAFAESRLGAALRSRFSADDVLQETYLRAFVGLERFEWRGQGSFYRWLAAIAELAIREMARTAARLPEGVEVEAASCDASPSSGLRRDERFERLMAAFEKLSPEHRRVLRLARLEGLPVKAIARRMARSESAVRHLILRALGKLREHFGARTGSFHLPPLRRLTEEESHGA
jgi:RNA polymerase sigma-70 factor (ECF subfamily)